MFFSSDSSAKRSQEVCENLYYYRENTMLDCNQYIINDKNTDEIALFDAGNGVSLKGLIEGLKQNNLKHQNITKVFLTHEHLDHVVGIYPLLKLMENQPPELFAYGETAKILMKGNEAQIFPRTLGINPRDFGLEIVPLKVIDIAEKKEIRVNSEFIFQIYYTPGHSLGSICYYEPNKKILIPGDLVFIGGSFGRYDFPGGSLSDLQNSIRLINKLDVKYLLPGHMGISHNGNQQIKFALEMVSSINEYF